MNKAVCIRSFQSLIISHETKLLTDHSTNFTLQKICYLILIILNLVKCFNDRKIIHYSLQSTWFLPPFITTSVVKCYIAQFWYLQIIIQYFEYQLFHFIFHFILSVNVFITAFILRYSCLYHYSSRLRFYFDSSLHL